MDTILNIGSAKLRPPAWLSRRETLALRTTRTGA